MISRYDKSEISSLWLDHFKFKTFLKVELALLKSLEHHKRIPVGVAKYIEENSKIDVKRIEEIEKTTHHDVIAFTSSITENLKPEFGKYFHFGVTSSDVIDTALTLQIKESLEQIIPSLKRVVDTLLKVAKETKDIITIGRSHGMYAEPMSFGHKFLLSHCEFKRRLKDLEEFYKNELTAQFSGAVGNYAILTPEIEEYAANLLGLKVEPVSTQVIPRDRIAKLISINSLIAASIERIAVEIRHLHRSDVGELHEGFAKGQKGSSTMPHKKNPISGENLTGLTRVLRSHVSVALDNVVLWHERDISHSSAERMFLPDNLGILMYALDRLNNTIENLDIHKDVIEERVKSNVTYLSSFYLHYLIEKTDLSRDDLYAIVQKGAFKAQEDQDAKIFHQEISKELEKHNIKLEALPELDFKELKKVYLSCVDSLFQRV